MSLPPLFIVASERSGTNLLRKRLTEKQDTYYGVEPAHFLKHLYHHQPFYGSFSDDQNFITMIKDAIKLCKLHFAPWDIEFEAKEIFSEYDSIYSYRNVFGVMDYMMKRYAISKGYKTYICKDNFLFDYLYQIKAYLEPVKFIYLYRDPRDVVLSQTKRRFGDQSIVNNAKLWRSEQVKSFQLFQDFFKDDCFLISYEDFIKDEENSLKQLFSFLGTEEAESENFYEEFVEAHDWKNLNKPTLKNNFGKYKTELSSKQIKLIETICHQEMGLLGYELQYETTSFSTFFLAWRSLRGKISRRLRVKLLKYLKTDQVKEKRLKRRRFVSKFRHPN